VRVLLEVDAPAHCSAGWSWGEEAGLGPLVLCADQQPWRSFCIQPPCGQLNPANPAVYAVLRAVYHDLVRLLPPGEALHLGGDEVFFPCWNASREVADYLQASGRGRGEADLLSLWAEFHAGSLAALDEAAGRADTTAILWSSHLTRPPHVDSYVDRDRSVGSGFDSQAWRFLIAKRTSF
jgi:hexosaminidase